MDMGPRGQQVVKDAADCGEPAPLRERGGLRADGAVGGKLDDLGALALIPLGERVGHWRSRIPDAALAQYLPAM
jgi:hypothetical protein